MNGKNIYKKFGYNTEMEGYTTLMSDIPKLSDTPLGGYFRKRSYGRARNGK